jgi:hypothetical protein
MDSKCAFCSVILAAPAPGAPLVCHNCGAAQPARAEAATARTPSPSTSIADLAKLSLDQPPAAMAKAMGVAVKRSALGKDSIGVRLSGSIWDFMVVMWDPDDPAHASMVQLSTDTVPDDDAAIRDRLAKALGSPLPKGGRLMVLRTGVAVSYNGAIASVLYVEPMHGPFPGWKQAMDAGWDLLRCAVLGLDVKVDEATLREQFRE